jgi:hypothetical protein
MIQPLVVASKNLLPSWKKNIRMHFDSNHAGFDKYCTRLGIQSIQDDQLRGKAKQLICEVYHGSYLPHGWRMIVTNDGAVYFSQISTDTVSWCHPADAILIAFIRILTEPDHDVRNSVSQLIRRTDPFLVEPLLEFVKLLDPRMLNCVDLKNPSRRGGGSACESESSIEVNDSMLNFVGEITFSENQLSNLLSRYPLTSGVYRIVT